MLIYIVGAALALSYAAAFLLEVQWAVIIAAKLRIRRVVMLKDHDGELRLQFLRKGLKGQCWCHAMGPIGHVLLFPDGTVRTGSSYVNSWEPYNFTIEKVTE